MRASLIRRHIMSRHPELNINSGVTDGDALERALANAKTVTENRVVVIKMVEDQSSPEKRKQQLEVFKPRHSMPSSMNLTPVSEACILCAAPNCNKYIHHSNMARHWRCWHPNLNKAEYVMKKPSLSNPCSPIPSIASAGKIVSHVQPTFNKRLSADLFDKRDSTSSPKVDSPANRLSASGFNLPMANGLYACRSGDCDYTTKYNSNMWRHRRKYNHFFDTNNSSMNVTENVITIDIKEEPLEEIVVDDIVVDEARLQTDSSLTKESEDGDIQETVDAANNDHDSTKNTVADEESKQTEEPEEVEEEMEVDSIEEKSDEIATEKPAEKTENLKEKEDLNQSSSKTESENLAESTPPKPKNRITAYFLPVPKSVEKVDKVESVDQHSAAKRAKRDLCDVDCQSTEDKLAKSTSVASSTTEIDV